MYSQDEQKQIIDDMSASIYNKERTYTEDELGKDAVWIEASKAVYKHFNGSDYVGTPEELAKEGLNIMGEFNYNMTFGTAAQTAKIQDADDYTKTAFYYMMDTYDKKDISSAGVGRAFKEMALDPLNYAMVIGTAGVGFFGKQAAGSAAKAALKEGLKQSAMRYMTNPVALGAVEGAAYTVADDYARQDAAVGAGFKEGYDPVQGAMAGAVGAGVGAGLVKAADVGFKAAGTGIEKISSSVKNYFNPQPKLPLSLDTTPAPAALVEAASKGDKEAYKDLANAVYSRTFEQVVNKNTSDQLKPMVLDKLVENPNVVEDLAKQFGYELKYFSSNPENVGRAIGDKVVEERPANRSQLKKKGYSAGNIWVYDPYDTHGSFDDPEYTKAWRGIHELAHGLTEKIMEAKYGESRRFGALGIDTKNPYDPNDPRTYKALSTEEAQRAIEWEDVAFRTQLKLLDMLGIPVDKQQAVNDFNIAGTDTVLRTLTGDFSDPGDYGVLPRTDDYRIEVNQVLELLQNQENELAQAQGRTPTQGIDLQQWQHVSDDELDMLINENLTTPLKKPLENTEDGLLMSIEAVPGASIDQEGKAIIQSLPYNEQVNYLKSVHTALTDQAGSSIVAKKLGLDVGKGSYTTGVWLGETNPVLQLEVKPEFGVDGKLTPEFREKLNDMAEIYAKALNQDGVAWSVPSFKNSTNVEVQNAVEFKTGKIMEKDTVAQISNELGDIAAIVSTKDGVRIINISELPNSEFISKVENSLQNVNDSGDVIYFSVENDFISGGSNDKVKTNSLTRRPDLQEWFDNNVSKQTERVKQRYTSKAKRQQETSE